MGLPNLLQSVRDCFKVREDACVAHIRRKFGDVFQAEGSVIAEEAIKRTAGVHAVEKDGCGQPPDVRVRLRQARAKPIVDDLETWLSAPLPRISGKGELAKAIRYALARMHKLRPYLEHGCLEADNNAAERAMKPISRRGGSQALFRTGAGGADGSRLQAPHFCSGPTELHARTPGRRRVVSR